MKKTLIALAVLAASTASMAQVTLYGVADVSVGAINQTTGLGLANDKFQAIASNVLNNGNSRFGMKGVEDLGGGMKVGFNYEGGINIATGAGNTSGGTLFARAANVYLEGGFGRLTAGRQLTTSFFSVASWELTGTANYSVVANQFGFNGGAGPRDHAAVKYDIAASGFNGSLMFIPEGDAVYGTATSPKGKYDVSVGYGAGPLVASLAYNKVDAGNEGTVVGGSYNFGAVKVAASWTQGKTGAGVVVAEGYSLGASVPMGAFTFTLDIANDTKFEDTDYLLEAKYALSKRTFVYGAYVRDGSSKGRVTAGNPLNKDVDGYALGLRHNF
jgi:predicted porin